MFEENNIALIILDSILIHYLAKISVSFSLRNTTGTKFYVNLKVKC